MLLILFAYDYDFCDLLNILYFALWIELNNDVYAGINVFSYYDLLISFCISYLFIYYNFKIIQFSY
jgi:hypothetical protein